MAEYCKKHEWYFDADKGCYWCEKEDKTVEYKVNSEKILLPKELFRGLERYLRAEIEDLDKYTGKDHYYIVIKVKI